MNLRVLVVDDEEMARRRLVRLLSARPATEVAGVCQDGAEVGPFLAAAEAPVDVILLDIDMPELSGLEAKGLLGSDGPLVVFVTAHAEHALAAFDAGALDYVLKPVDPERLGRALDRATHRSEARKTSALGMTPSDLDRLAIPTRRGLELLRPNDIRYALVDGASVVLHTERATFVTDFRIVALERRLPKERFLRTHRRALVNLDHVVRLEGMSAGTYVAELTDGAMVPVSRQAAKRLKQFWDI